MVKEYSPTNPRSVNPKSRRTFALSEGLIKRNIKKTRGTTPKAYHLNDTGNNLKGVRTNLNDVGRYLNSKVIDIQ